jgi:hypothetical protein
MVISEEEGPEVNGQTYMIAYATLPNNFDKLLPTVDQMIRSFKSGV